VSGLQKVVLVHGEPDGQVLLANRIREELSVDVIVPQNGDVIELG